MRRRADVAGKRQEHRPHHIFEPAVGDDHVEDRLRVRRDLAPDFERLEQILARGDDRRRARIAARPRASAGSATTISNAAPRPLRSASASARPAKPPPPMTMRFCSAICDISRANLARIAFVSNDLCPCAASPTLATAVLLRDIGRFTPGTADVGRADRTSQAARSRTDRGQPVSRHQPANRNGRACSAGR